MTQPYWKIVESSQIRYHILNEYIYLARKQALIYIDNQVYGIITMVYKKLGLLRMENIFLFMCAV